MAGKKIPLSLGALEVEAIAVDTSLIFAEDVGTRGVIVESDSCLATRAALGPALPPTTISRVISSILPFHIIAEKVVSNVSFGYIPLTLVQEISKVGKKETQQNCREDCSYMFVIAIDCKKINIKLLQW